MKFRSKQTQSNLFDYHERMAQLAKRPMALDKLNAAIDFEQFRPLLR